MILGNGEKPYEARESIGDRTHDRSFYPLRTYQLSYAQSSQVRVEWILPNRK